MKLKSTAILVALLAHCAYGDNTYDQLQDNTSDDLLDILDLTSSGDSVLNNDTLTESCAERTIAESTVPLYPKPVTIFVKTYRIAFYTPLLIAALFSNTFVIYLVASHKKLRTLSFGITLQVAVVNIALAILVIVPTLITTIAGRWILGPYCCSIFGFMLTWLSFIRTNLMFVFVIDRFLSVFYPYFYPKYKVKIAVVLSVVSWAFVSVVRIVTVPGILDCYGFLSSINNCSSSSACNSACAIYGSVSFLLVGLPSTVVPLVLYTALYCKARQLQKNTASLAVSVSANSVSLQEKQRETRATFTFFLLFITLFAVTAPTVSIQIGIAQFSSPDQLLWPGLYVLQVITARITSLLLITDPIVILRDRDVRAILNEMKGSLVQKLCPSCCKCLAANTDD